MTDQQPEAPDKLLYDLESLQALLDQEADDLSIPLLRDVVEPGDAASHDALLPAVAASTLELDFDGFEVDEQLLRNGLGLEEPAATAPAREPEQVTVPEPVPVPWPAPPAPVPEPAAIAAVAVAPGFRDATPAVTQQEDPSALLPEHDELAAELVEQCLAELETLLRPRLTQLCRDLLARRAPYGAE